MAFLASHIPILVSRYLPGSTPKTFSHRSLFKQCLPPKMLSYFSKIYHRLNSPILVYSHWSACPQLHP